MKPLLRALIPVLLAALPLATHAASTAYSPAFTVDTRGAGNLPVTGRVLVRDAGLALTGAAVDLAGRNTATGSDGRFSFKVDLAAGATLTASKTGYLSQTRTVTAAAGQKSVSVDDIQLVTSVTGSPVIEYLQPSFTGMLLPGWGVSLTAEAKVNWNGLNPGSVKFYANGSLITTKTGSGPNYSTAFDIDVLFTPSLRFGANSIFAVATSAEGAVSETFWREVIVLPVPGSLAPFLLAPENIGNEGAELSLKVNFPSPDAPITKTLTIPVVGDLAGKVQASGEFTYNLDSGQWELEFGGEASEIGRSQFKLGLGPLDNLGAEIKGVGRGSATARGGISFDSLSLEAGLSLSGEYDFLWLGVLDVIVGPGTTQELAKVPGLKEALKPISILFWLKPELSGEIAFGIVPKLDFESLGFTGKLALEASYEPNIVVAKVKFYGGGEPRVTFQIPGDFIAQVGFKAYAGLEATVLGVLVVDLECVFVDYTYPSAGSPPPPANLHDVGTGYLIEAAANKGVTWKPMERPWRENGAETFVQAAENADLRMTPATAPPSSASTSGISAELDVFAQMGKAAVTGVVFVPSAVPEMNAAAGAPAPPPVIVSDPALPAQMELPLLENVFPDSEPTLAGAGDDLMLLYVRDTGAANPVQFTEIGWTFFDGITWTTPAAVAADPRGQFEPVVVFDGAGAAVAVWTQIKDAGFEGSELDALAAQMEIVSAKWDPATQTWGAPAALTDNAFLDHKPRLAGPLPDGDLILTWRENQGTLLIGSGAPGALENTRILTRRWDAATAAWGAAEVLVPDLANELSDSLAAGGNKAVLVLTRDLDGDLDDMNDAEVFYRIWDEGAGVWGALTRHTNDALYDRHAKAALDAAGGIYCVWQRGDDLVMDRDFAGAPVPVRPDSATLGFSDFALTVGPGGNVVAVWQEMGEFGPDAHYRVFDPASDTWGLDTLLSQDADLERSFALVWDPMANLVLAYNNVEIVKQTKTVALEGGGAIDVEGVPQPGQVDLLLAKRALVKDLAFVADSLTAEGATYLPGDAVTFRATVKNTGNVAVENVQAAFYDGDPEAGGTLIQTVTVPGWLKASDEAEVTAAWTVPEPAIARTAHVVVDPSNAVTEFDETNNGQSLDLNGVDLDLQYVSGSVLRDGSVRAVVRVKNLGAPEAPVSTLALKLIDGVDALAEVSVSQLDPGDSVEIPLDLPASSQAEGDQSYRLVIDEAGASGDIDTGNNEVLFSLNLWIDDDGDGIPHWWEAANGMSDSDPDDALADVDRDGFNGKAEYFSGTNPQDGASYLKPGEFNVVAGANGTTCTLSWASVEGRLYRVERSYDLITWETAFDDVSATPPLNGVEEEIVPRPARVFYRIIAK